LAGVKEILTQPPFGNKVSLLSTSGLVGSVAWTIFDINATALFSQLMLRSETSSR
jgi:hypothetical protein